MKRMEQVLFYQFPDELLAQTAAVFHRLGIKTEVLPAEASGERLGYLLGWGGFRPAAAPARGFGFPHEVMIMSGIKGRRLDEVLRALRRAKVPKITYKAVVTPYNIGWTLARLCETMRKEHEYIAQQQEKNAREG